MPHFWGSAHAARPKSLPANLSRIRLHCFPSTGALRVRARGVRPNGPPDVKPPTGGLLKRATFGGFDTQSLGLLLGKVRRSSLAGRLRMRYHIHDNAVAEFDSRIFFRLFDPTRPTTALGNRRKSLPSSPMQGLNSRMPSCPIGGAHGSFPPGLIVVRPPSLWGVQASVRWTMPCLVGSQITCCRLPDRRPGAGLRHEQN